MDWQVLINIAAGGTMALLGWLARQLWDAVAELRNDIHKIETDLPSTYAKKDEVKELMKEIKNDHKEDMREIKEILNKIFIKLDEKIDK